MTPLSVLVPAPAASARLAERVERLSGRAVELIRLSGGPVGAARNQAVGSARQPYALFLDGEPPETSFLEQACRALDAGDALAFVTSFGGVDGAAPRPCTAVTLLGRPLFTHFPTVFRRRVFLEVGGCDETLDGCEDVDLWLRVLGAGHPGVVLQEPVPRVRPFPGSLGGEPITGARAGAALLRLLEKHRALLDEHREEVVLAKERLLRELADRARRQHAHRLQLEHDLRALTDESTDLRRRIAGLERR